MVDIQNTRGRHPVPPGTRCDWPACSSPANGSVGTNGDRLWFCLTHLAEFAARVRQESEKRNPPPSRDRMPGTVQEPR
jgi:hypothetical protein